MGWARWWEHLLHYQGALRLRARLLFTPGVMVCSVPHQLASAHDLVDAQAGCETEAVSRRV